MPTLKELADAHKDWASQEASDIASGTKQVPSRVDPPTKLTKPVPPGGVAAGVLSKEPMPDLGHTVPTETDLHSGALKSTPGASIDRGRQLAQSVREGRSSVAKPAISTEPKAAAPIESGKPAEIVTDTGEQAGATTAGPKYGGTRAEGFESRAPKDLGRVSTKVLRGGYGDISAKTAGQVKGSFLSRAAESIAGKVGSTLGAYGSISLAAKASSAYQGLKSGQAVNPLTLDTSPVRRGKKYLTPGGVKSGEELGAGEEM